MISSGLRHGIITSRYLFTKNLPVVCNTNIRIFGCRNTLPLLKTKFPKTKNLFFDYCDNKFIYNNLKSENFPNIECIYFANGNHIEFDTINFSFNGERVYSDVKYSESDTKLVNINLINVDTKLILQLWNDQDIELLKY